MGSKISFISLKPDQKISINDIEVSFINVRHPGGGTAYSINHKNKKIVFTGDVEFLESDLNHLDSYGNFFNDSDIAIFDSQYTLEESFYKFDWGHTSYNMAVNLAMNWNVKKLILTHFEPNYSDLKIAEIEKLAKEHVFHINNVSRNNIEMDIQAAYEGLEIDL